MTNLPMQPSSERFKPIVLTKWDWLAKKEGLASERIDRATAPTPCYGQSEYQDLESRELSKQTKRHCGAIFIP